MTWDLIRPVAGGKTHALGGNHNDGTTFCGRPFQGRARQEYEAAGRGEPTCGRCQQLIHGFRQLGAEERDHTSGRSRHGGSEGDPAMQQRDSSLPQPAILCTIDNPGDELAARLYAAYNRGGDPATAGLNYQGKPCPQWPELPPNVQAKWRQTAAFAHQVLGKKKKFGRRRRRP